MGWNASLTESSALGSSITFTPDTSTTGEYTVSSFTAPRKGVYRFQLMGSGGAKGPALWESRNLMWNSAGGVGGFTDGYLLLEKGQTVYIGAGGPCSAAFVSAVTGANLSAVDKSALLFAAGGGGQGGSIGESYNNTGWNCKSGQGGAGGGTSGAQGGYDSKGGTGGTQSAGGASKGEDSAFTLGGSGTYGVGGSGSHSWSGPYEALGGRGGDGYYGGGAGGCFSRGDSGPYTARGMGGGGGSGYVKTETLTVRDKTYTSTTSQSGGAESNTNGSVVVTYFARAELPINFNGTQLDRLFFNGVEIGSVIFNGTKLFFERMRRRAAGWCMWMRAAM